MAQVFYARVCYPFVDASAPVEFNTCTELAPVVVYDVNGYYAELGVSPTATRRQIKQRYLEIEGHKSPRLTYIVKQLLNPEVRSRYDASPPGYAFWDQYVENAEIDRILAQVGNDISAEQMDNLLGDIDRLVEVLTREERGLLRPRGWGSYHWQTRHNPSLDVWRGLLSTHSECKMYLSVGVMGRHMPVPFYVSRIGYRIVVFLRDGEDPSRWAAQAAAEARALATI